VRQLAGLTAVTITCLLAAGCTRAFYRHQADADAYCLVQQKASDPRWPLEGYSIEIDPRSRMFDPFDPDCPPMPPDDPVSHRLMHCVDGMKGFPFWHAQGDTPYVEGPNWLRSLPWSSEGKVLIDADTAVQLALLNSPVYQRQLEELFLSALDVSFERFRFDAQFFGGYRVEYRTDGRARRVDVPGKSLSVLDTGTTVNGHDWQTRKLFATGGELIVGLANSLVWQFSGPDSHTALTLLDFSLVQPLLRGAGRAVVLERLTIAERALLANVRQMERFRRGFYVQLLTGQFSGLGPTRRGGIFGGSGLEGFTGVGGGGFGRLADQGIAFNAAQVAGITGAGGGLAGGFFGLLQLQQSIRNQRANIAALNSSVAQLEALFEADRIDFFQVELARTALVRGESQLLNQELDYRRRLDNFKIEVGLPPGLEFEVDDSLIKPLELIDHQDVDRQNRITAIQRDVGDTVVALLESVVVPPEPDRDDQRGQTAPGDRRQAAAPIRRPELAWNATVEAQLSDLRNMLRRAVSLGRQARTESLPRARRDLETLRRSMQQRHQAIPRLRKTVQLFRQFAVDAPGEVDETLEDVEMLPYRPEDLERVPTQISEAIARVSDDLEAVLLELDQVDQQLARLLEEGPQLPPAVIHQRFREQIATQLPDLLNELTMTMLSLTLIQARARTESVQLVPVLMEWQDAYRVAGENRRDWMNARANLVDSWRLIRFNANALRSDLNILFSGDIANTGDNPIRLRSSTGRLRAGIEFDAPLTRLAERNTYRQSLIEYQQARRAFYQFRDQVAADLRDNIRGLYVNQLNFEFRRRAVEVAISQVELTQLRLSEPPLPEQEAFLGVTTARDLVSALTDLLDAQNDFLSVWISQEVQRRLLDFNMGTMQLDQRGIWIDPGPIEDVAEDCLPKGAPDDGNLSREQASEIEYLPPIQDPQVERLPDLEEAG
jgi:hypothetical protein